MKRPEIRVRRKAGQNLAAIARETGVPTRTAKRVVKEAKVLGEVAPRRPRPGRPNKVEGHRAFLVKPIAKSPDLATLAVLHRARQAGDSGGKSALHGSPRPGTMVHQPWNWRDVVVHEEAKE